MITKFNATILSLALAGTDVNFPSFLPLLSVQYLCYLHDMIMQQGMQVFKYMDYAVGQ